MPGGAVFEETGVTGWKQGRDGRSGIREIQGLIHNRATYASAEEKFGQRPASVVLLSHRTGKGRKRLTTPPLHLKKYNMNQPSSYRIRRPKG